MTKEEILSKHTGLSITNEMVLMQTQINYILQAMEEYAQQQVNKLTIPAVRDWLSEDVIDCGCEPEVCKMIKGKCKNLAYR